MVVIRLARVGKKNSPAYRVVVADKQRAVKRKFIEVIGHYNPTLKPKELVIDKERANFWMGKGAQASDTVRNLMVDLGILEKSAKINKVYGKAVTKKAAKEGGSETKAPLSTDESPVSEESTESIANEENTEAEANQGTETPSEEPQPDSEAGTSEENADSREASK